MKVSFRKDELERLWSDPRFDGGFAPAIVRAFRKVVQFIRRARDERDLRSMKSLRYEKLSGQRKHQRSLRLNDQWRLIVEPEGEGAERVVVIVAVEDYH